MAAYNINNINPSAAMSMNIAINYLTYLLLILIPYILIRGSYFGRIIMNIKIYIFGIAGKRMSGKDSLAAALRWRLPNCYIFHLASPLRGMGLVDFQNYFCVRPQIFEHDLLDKTFLTETLQNYPPPGKKLTPFNENAIPRELLINLGLQGRKVQSDLWIQCLKTSLITASKYISEKLPEGNNKTHYIVFLITDVRFINEAKAVKVDLPDALRAEGFDKVKGYLIYLASSPEFVEKHNIAGVDTNPSEVEQDNPEFYQHIDVTLLTKTTNQRIEELKNFLFSSLDTDLAYYLNYKKTGIKPDLFISLPITSNFASAENSIKEWTEKCEEAGFNVISPFAVYDKDVDRFYEGLKHGIVSGGMAISLLNFAALSQADCVLFNFYKPSIGVTEEFVLTNIWNKPYAVVIEDASNYLWIHPTINTWAHDRLFFNIDDALVFLKKYLCYE
jgi:hypothetical protein